MYASFTKNLTYCLFLTISVLLGTSLAGCSTKLVEIDMDELPTVELNPELYVPTLDDVYRIRVGDKISIHAYFNPQLNQNVFVRSDGRISLLLIGEIFVAGMAPAQLEEYITQQYTKLVDTSEITVVITESVGDTIFLGGEVKIPSTQPHQHHITLIQAITTAGGVLSTANLTDVILLRKQESGYFKGYKVDVESILVNEKPDVYLKRHDIVYVPKTAIAHVGQFVDQYINKIVPRFVLVSYGWLNTSEQAVQLSPR